MFDRRILPSLYPIAPSLQALAILTDEPASHQLSEPEDARILPMITISDLDESVACELEECRQALADPNDSIVVFDASGTCLWTSHEFDHASLSGPVVDSDSHVNGLSHPIRSVLASLSEHDSDSMDLG